MKLGSSLRRRRPSGGGQKPARSRKVKFGREGWGRLLLFAVGVVVLGSGMGYAYATHVVFPAPNEPRGEFLEVPDLRGLAFTDAETFLREWGLNVGAVDSVHHPELDSGVVLGQSPLPGQLGLTSGVVDLTLSLGPERRPVPDVTRLGAERAWTVLQATGFQVVVDSVEADIPEGRVVATEPEAGEELALPGEVRLTISLGPPLFPMPDLAGLQEERARVLLDSLGLELGEVETRFRFGFNQGEVLEHFPRPDSLVPAGTAVRMVIGRRGFFQDSEGGN